MVEVDWTLQWLFPLHGEWHLFLPLLLPGNRNELYNYPLVVFCQTVLTVDVLLSEFAMRGLKTLTTYNLQLLK